MTVNEIMLGVVHNYQDIDGLMEAQMKLAHMSYQMAEEYAMKRKQCKLLDKQLNEDENNDFLNFSNEKGVNTTKAKALAKNARNKQTEIKVIELEADYKVNDCKIRQINKFLSAINQQISSLKQEKQQTKYELHLTPPIS